MADAVGGTGGDAGVERGGHLAATEDPCGTVPDRLTAYGKKIYSY